MENKYVKEIIAALKDAHQDIAVQNITPSTKFEDIEGLDSAIIVAFQINLSKAIGDIADEAQPMPEMTIEDFAKEIELAEK
ncbi:MAG: hypothetical protein IJI37_06510 [Opitutales bacterium]|nr:hypothetical protein [Opitutales bacterium]